MTRLLALLAALWIGLVGLTSSLSAHNAPGSSVLLDFQSRRLDLELRLPLSELEYSFREALLDAPSEVVRRQGDRLATYVSSHVRITAPDGRPWRISVVGMEVALQDEPLDLVVRVEATPPEGASVRRFDLCYDVVSHEVMNHVVMVLVRSDWMLGRLGQEPELIGTLRSFSPELPVDRAADGERAGLSAVFALGARHILEGTDHLLFLLVLLLPATVAVSRGRWCGPVGVRVALRRLARIVTAFTVGHSITLALGALGWISVPARPVEVVIAISILIGAVHALRPLFPGREAWVAGVFGCVHGLAFATVLTELHLEPVRLVQALLAFNVGIEVMQLAVVLLTLPWLVLLSHSRVFSIFLRGSALLALGAATAWLIERLQGSPNVVSRGLDALSTQGGWLIVALAAFSLIGSFWPRRAWRPTFRPSARELAQTEPQAGETSPTTGEAASPSA